MSSAHIEPVDDGTPNKTSGTIGHDVEANAFAKAINKIVKETTPVPSPNSGNPIYVMVPTPQNSALSSSNANSTSKIVQIFFRMIQ